MASVSDITETRKKERLRDRENRVNQILTELYVPLTDPQVIIFDIAQIILHKAKDFTGSRQGFISGMDPETGKSSFRSLSKMIQSAGGMDAGMKERIFPDGLDAKISVLWGSARENYEAFYSNNITMRPGLNEKNGGHPLIERLLAVPVKLGSEVAGEIVLGNPGRDYDDDDLYCVNRLGEFYGLAIQRRRARDELELSLFKNRILLDTATQFTYELDPAENGNFKVTDLSESFLRITGYTLKELSENNGYLRLFFKDDFPGMAEGWRARIAGKNETPLEFRIKTRTGEIKWLRDYCSPVWDESHTRIRKIYGAIQDITASKEIEENLRNSEELLRQIFDSSPDRIYMKDGNGRILLANNATCGIYGIRKDDLTGKTVFDLAGMGLLKKAEAVEINRADKEAFETGNTTVIPEECISTKDGKVRWFRTIRIPIVYRGDRRVLGVSMEITQLREQEEEIGRQLERYDDLQRVLENKDQKIYETYYQLNQIFNSSPVGMCVVDKEFNILMANDTYCRLTNLELKDVIRSKCYAAFRSDRCLTPDCCLRKIMQGERKQERQSIAERTDESTVPCYIVTQPFYDFHGELIGIVHAYQDISQILKAQEELKNKEMMLLQSQKMEAIGRLAGGIAHDFNNLLTIIKGYSELLMLKSGDDTEMSEGLNEIFKASTSAASLTGQLLAFSRKQVLDFKVIDLNRVLDDMEKMLKRVVGENIVIVIRPGLSLSPVRADRSQIEQVIMNLVVNAHDALPDGGQIVISTGKESFENRTIPTASHPVTGEFVLLSIEDNGIGMSQQTVEKVFEPFFTTKSIGEGTGLGLPTVFGIVKQHDGFIHVISELGKGSRFEVYFPVPSRMAEIFTGAAVPDKKSSAKGRGELVLIVEDETALSEFARRLLEDNQYRVATAGSIGKAKEVYQNKKSEISLVFTDMVLTDGFGMDLIQYLKSSDPSMKIIATSGYIDRQVDLGYFSDQNIPFIKKPYEIAQFLETVHRILHGGRV